MPLLGKPFAILTASFPAIAAVAIGFPFFFPAESNLALVPEKTVRVATACTHTHTAFGITPSSCSVGSSDAFGFRPAFPAGSGAAGLEPGDAVLMSGQKSVVAGADTFMAMGIAEMADGSLAADGSRFEFVDSENRSVVAYTLGGIAHHVYKAPSQAGYVEVVGKWAERSTLPNTIRIVPADPVQIGLQEKPVRGRLSGDRQYWIKSTAMKDQFGNTLNDGSYVQFSGVDDAGRPVFLNTVLVNGIASAKFIQREMQGSLHLSGRFKDVVGSHTRYALGGTQIRRDVKIAHSGKADAVDLEVGPLRLENGAHVPDGTRVTLELADGRGFSSVTRDGLARFAYSAGQNMAGAQLVIRAGTQIWQFEASRSSRNDRVSGLDGAPNTGGGRS